MIGDSRRRIREVEGLRRSNRRGGSVSRAGTRTDGSVEAAG